MCQFFNIQSLGSEVVCRKCKALACINARQNDPFCADCFNKEFYHKFLSTFGKYKLISKGEKVLIDFNGGADSSLLRHLVLSSIQSLNNYPKLHLDPMFIYIYDNIIKKQPFETFDNLYITSLLNLYTEFPLYFTNFQTFFEFYENYKDSIQISNLNLNSYILRKKLLAKIAKSLNISKILIGDNMNTISSRSLVSMINGAGIQMANNVAFLEINDDILFIKPLKWATAKEVAYYMHFNNIDCYIPSKAILESPSNLSSVKQVTSNFLNSMQKEFPSLNSAICRIGDKIETQTKSISTTLHQCQFCMEKSANLESYELNKSTASPKWVKLCYRCQRISESLFERLPPSFFET